MKIDIQPTDIELQSTDLEQIHRKLNLAMSRMEPLISKISMHLSNVIDSSHGNEKYCRLKITLAHMPDEIVIDETQTDLAFAIDRVVQKACRIMSRKLDNDK